MDNPYFEQLEKDSSGFMRSSLLLAMAELDVATAILQLNNAATSLKLAEKLDLDLRSLEVLLDALAACGYLEKKEVQSEATYGVVQGYRELLDRKNPHSYIPMLRHRASMQRKWSKLSFAIETGTPIAQVDSFLGDKEDRVSFIKAMNAIALKLAPGTLQALEQAGVFKNLPATAHILDIGGASGTYTEAFLRHLPSSTATIFDLPQGISQAKKRFQNSDLENRVELVEGDFTKQGFQGSFDLAFISAIIHQLDSLGCRDLFSKAWAALKPKGLVVVRDFVMREDRIFPEAGALFGVNMLVATESGCVYTFCEIKADLEAAGFKKVELAVDTPNMSAIVTALK